MLPCNNSLHGAQTQLLVNEVEATATFSGSVGGDGQQGTAAEEGECTVHLCDWVGLHVDANRSRCQLEQERWAACGPRCAVCQISASHSTLSSSCLLQGLEDQVAALQADKQRLAREGTQMARALREAVQARKQAQAEVAAARAALQQAQAVAWGDGIQIGEPGCRWL